MGKMRYKSASENSGENSEIDAFHIIAGVTLCMQNSIRRTLMSIQNYGVLKAQPLQGVQATAGSPHYQILVVDENEMKYRIAVNVESQDQPVDLLYYIDVNFQHAITSQL